MNNVRYLICNIEGRVFNDLCSRMKIQIHLNRELNRAWSEWYTTITLALTDKHHEQH